MVRTMILNTKTSSDFDIRLLEDEMRQLEKLCNNNKSLVDGYPQPLMVFLSVTFCSKLFWTKLTPSSRFIINLVRPAFEATLENSNKLRRRFEFNILHVFSPKSFGL